MASDKRYQPAGFWKRTAAFVFDLLVINLVVFWPFQRVFEGYARSLSLSTAFLEAEQGLPQQLYLAVLVISILALLYFTFFDYYLQQTPGKMLFDIRAIDLASNDGSIGFWKALARNIFILPFFPFYIFWIVEPIHLAFYKERFLERITNTKTVIMKQKIFEGISEEYKLKKVE